jgi:glucose-1-phosphate cytidylyltransferase
MNKKQLNKKISELKLVILAGGLGSRLSEETAIKPKPLVEIGGEPIILHLMRYYSYYGVKNFIICLGYKGNMIREYFINRYLPQTNFKIDLKKHPNLKFSGKKKEDWTIEFINTGVNSLTGRRLKLIEPYVGENFLFTYGDGLSNIPIDKTIEIFFNSKCLGLLSSVKINPKFGIIQFGKKNLISSFQEKKSKQETWINGGFGIFNKKALKFIPNKNLPFEQLPLSKMAKHKKLISYKHKGFWKCMDTLRDKQEFEEIFKKKPFWFKK